MYNQNVYSLLLLVSIAACGPKQGEGGIEVPKEVNGFKYSFIPPRNDIPPGTVVIVWDKPQQTIDVVCRTALFHKGDLPPPPPTPAVAVSEDEKQNAKNALEASILGAIKLSGNAESASSLKGTYNGVRPVGLDDVAGLIGEAQKSAECQERARTLAKGRKVRNFQMVSEVLEMTFDYTAQTSSDQKLALQTTKDVAGVVGSGASVEVGGEQNRTVSINGAKIYTRFNTNNVDLPKE